MPDAEPPLSSVAGQRSGAALDRRRDVVVALGDPKVFWSLLVAVIVLNGAARLLHDRWWWAGPLMTLIAVAGAVIGVRWLASRGRRSPR